MQVSRQKKMSVVDLPDSKPLITGARPRGYKVREGGRFLAAKMATHTCQLISKVGEWLDANCSSPNSKPPAELKWYINNEMV